MLTKARLQALAQIRLDDAQLLLSQSRFSSAYYLAGYAIELGLKAFIAGKFETNVIPDKNFVNSIYTHDLEQLKKTAGLTPTLKEASQSDPLLEVNWGIASKWTESSRYDSD